MADNIMVASGMADNGILVRSIMFFSGIFDNRIIGCRWGVYFSGMACNNKITNDMVYKLVW